MTLSQIGITKTEVATLLGAGGLAPKRSLGQNFLIDANQAKKIATLAAAGGGPIVEIGPGIGSLTVFLASMCERVVTVEKDKAMAGLLGSTLSSRGLSNVEIVVADALEVDWHSLLTEHGIEVVAGNLPYNVSVPIIMKLVDETPEVAEMTFLLQREVAERLAAEPGARECSAVSLKTRLHYRASIAARVPPTVFVPVPNVSSAVLKLFRDDSYIKSYGVRAVDEAVSAARRAFAHRRQMVRRTMSDPRLAQALRASGVEGTRRPESLTVQEWLAIGSALGVGGTLDV